MNIALQDTDFGIRTAPDTVRVERLLPGPIQRVWDYLTIGELRAQWLAAGEMEPREGGLVDLVFNNNRLTRNDDAPAEKYAKYGGESHLPGRMTEWNPPRLLAFDWGAGASNSHRRATRCAWSSRTADWQRATACSAFPRAGTRTWTSCAIAWKAANRMDSGVRMHGWRRSTSAG